jgi:hypothetical protein
VALRDELAQKSVLAAISAIEIYNKPHFLYREEAFALLMANAWELLLKARWIANNDDDAASLHVIVSDNKGGTVLRTNRSGNPMSYGLVYLAGKLVQDKTSGLLQACHDNILALIEIRDNAAHFINKDLYLGKRVLEIGTASLRNYLQLATDWFKIDLSMYNFFLMPISFYHGFDAIEPATRGPYPQNIQHLLSFLDKLEAADTDHKSTQRVALRLETKLVKSKDADAIAFRLTSDPGAPAVLIREEDVLSNYPYTYNELTDAMKDRYSDFIQGPEYHTLRRKLEKENKFCIQRVLNPKNPRSSRQKFYNANIFQAFDKHYKKK